MPASPASTTRPREPAAARRQQLSRKAASSARPTKAWRLRSASSGAGQRRAPGPSGAVPGTRAGRRTAGAPPRSIRSCTAIAAGPGAVPSSSRRRRRRSSNTRSASAGLPAASWTSIRSRCEDSRNGAAATAARAASSASPSSPARRQASASTSSARTRSTSSDARWSRTHDPSQSGRKAAGSAVRACRAAVSADRQAPSCSAASARRAARAASSTSTVTAPGATSRTLERPTSAPEPSTRRSLDRSALSAVSAAAGGASGHSRSISSPREQGRSRLSAR